MKINLIENKNIEKNRLIKNEKNIFFPFLGINYSNNKIEIQSVYLDNSFFINDLNEEFIDELFLDLYNNNNIKCSFCNLINSNKNSFFCFNCNNLICNKCLNFHKNHNFLELNKINFECFIHKNNKISYFCKECLKFFCDECLKNKNEHKEIININNLIINNRKLLEFKDCINDSINKIKLIENEYLTYKNKLNEMIIKLEESFKLYKKFNELEIKLSQKILDFYLFSIENNQINYQSIQNIYNIFNFNLKTIDINPNDNTFFIINKIYDFLTNYENFILKDSNLNLLIMKCKSNQNKNKTKIKENNNNINKSFLQMDIKKEIHNHLGPLTCILPFNEKYILTSSCDCKINLFDIKNNFSLILTLNEHRYSVNYIIKLFDDRIMSCSDDYSIKIFSFFYDYYNNLNYNVDQILLNHNHNVIKIHELSNKKIMSCSSDQTIKIFYQFKRIYYLESSINLSICNMLQINFNEIVTTSYFKDEINFIKFNTYEIIKTIAQLTSNLPDSIIKINNDLIGIAAKGIILIQVSTHNIIKRIEYYQNNQKQPSNILIRFSKNIILFSRVFNNDLYIKEIEIKKNGELECINEKFLGNYENINCISYINKTYVLINFSNSSIIYVYQ